MVIVHRKMQKMKQSSLEDLVKLFGYKQVRKHNFKFIFYIFG